MSDETKQLMEVDVKRTTLLSALKCASNIAKEIGIGALCNVDGDIEGICLTRGVYDRSESPSKYKTMYYIKFPIFIKPAFDGGSMGHFEVHVEEWSVVLMSGTEQFVRALENLPPRDDGTYRMMISQKETESDNVESTVILMGLRNAWIGSSICHPVELGSDEIKDMYPIDERLECV